MVRSIEGEVSRAELEGRGWTTLPPLDASDVGRLSGIAEEVEQALLLHRTRVEAGFYELWGYPELQRQTQPLLAAVVAPFLERCFPGHRSVLFNLWVKRGGDEQSFVKFHHDFAFVDERAGKVGLQIWIPLVDVDAHNGALILVGGTHVDATPLRPLDHKHPLVDHSLTDLPAGAVQLALRAGHGVVFTNRTVHGSPPNRSAEPRFAVGAMLVPRDESIACWFSCPTNRLELWRMTDEQFATHQPGELPEGATFVDAVDRARAAAAPSSRVELGDAEWLCFRSLPQATGKAVVTDAAGRFLLLDADDLLPGERNASKRQRLIDLGFVRTNRVRVETPPEPTAGTLPLDIASMTDEACETLVASGEHVTIVFDAIPQTHEANRPLTGAASYETVAHWIREIHRRSASLGLDAETAYVNVVSPVTRATLAAGARAVVDASRAFGIVYLELQSRGLSADEYAAFYRDAVARVLEINVAGTLLVERRLALHLEALVELAAGRPLAPVVAPGCAECAYDQFCGTSFVVKHLAAGEPVNKRFGSDFCGGSMGTLDTMFERLAPAEATTLRRVFKRWMEARGRVAARR
jgi:hypothetical protein